MPGHVDVDRLSYVLPDGRLLLNEVSFRVGDGVRRASSGRTARARPRCSSSSPVIYRRTTAG